jgi:4-oxalocrotonate tautomerase family enzyme
MSRVEISGMAVPLEQKRELARRATELAAEIYQVSPSIITVVIRENSPENVAIAETLIVDRKESLE